MNKGKPTPIGNLTRACFMELLDDGKPHTLKEIIDYTIQKAEEKGITGDIDSKSVWMAVYQVTKKRTTNTRASVMVFIKKAVSP